MSACSKQSDAVLELTRAITQQVLESRGLLPTTVPDISTEAGREQLKGEIQGRFTFTLNNIYPK